MEGAYRRGAKTSSGSPQNQTLSYLNNHVEQDHWGIKQRYRPIYGFEQGNITARFCRLFDEIRALLRP